MAVSGRHVAFYPAFVGIGSNLGDRIGYCVSAAREILSHGSASLMGLSSMYETKALSSFPQPDYINCAVKISWRGSARELLYVLRDIEDKFDRVRTVPKGPRTIDLDILLFSSQIVDDADLVLPHPELHKRRFALVPCLELEPGLIHPIFGVSLQECLKALSEDQAVRRVKGAPQNLQPLCGADFCTVGP